MTYQGLYDSHHISHHKNFPPQDYADLNRADLTLLAPILVGQPDRDTPAFQAHKHTTQQLIAKLPSHLRSKLPLLTTFCSQHKKLNPLPLISLWKAIRRDADRELAITWSKARLTPAQSHFIDRLRRFPWHTQQSNCAACALLQLASDNDLLIAVGAITLATLSRRNWKKSKRVAFLRGLLEGRVSPVHAAGAVQKMFELGDRLRDLRQSAREQSQHRPPVDNSVAGYTTGVARGPPRPQRCSSQADHVAVTVAALSQGVELNDIRQSEPGPTVTGEGRMNEGSPVRFSIPRKPVPGTPKPSSFRDAFQQNGESVSHDTASSVYSSDSVAQTSRGSVYSSEASNVSESTIIDLYHHPAFPKVEQQLTDNQDGDSKSDMLSPLPPHRDSELANTPRHKLAPIWIPRSNYGGESALRTSGLWKRRFEDRVPQFRLGKNGEIKGPLDSVSEYDANNWI